MCFDSIYMFTVGNRLELLLRQVQVALSGLWKRSCAMRLPSYWPTSDNDAHGHGQCKTESLVFGKEATRILLERCVLESVTPTGLFASKKRSSEKQSTASRPIALATYTYLPSSSVFVSAVARKLKIIRISLCRSTDNGVRLPAGSIQRRAT